MSMDAIFWAMKQGHLAPLEKFVLLCLADNAFEDQTAVGMCGIAQYTNLKESEVPSVIDQLLAAGVIQRSGQGRYLLNMPVELGSGRLPQEAKWLRAAPAGVRARRIRVSTLRQPARPSGGSCCPGKARREGDNRKSTDALPSL